VVACVVVSCPVNCVKLLIVLPPIVANKREVVDTVLAVRFPDEIEEAYRASVLNFTVPAAIAVESVESPDWMT
jgi:hypothetical protein